MARRTPEQRADALAAYLDRGARRVAEVAAEHHVSESTLRRWARGNTPPKPTPAIRHVNDRPAAGLAGSVHAHVEALRREQQIDTEGDALAELALALAGQLDAAIDDPDSARYVAAWARELRQTLVAITPKGAPDDDDGDAWLDDLPPEVRDRPQP